MASSSVEVSDPDDSTELILAGLGLIKMKGCIRDTGLLEHGWVQFDQNSLQNPVDFLALTLHPTGATVVSPVAFSQGHVTGHLSKFSRANSIYRLEKTVPLVSPSGAISIDRHFV